MGKPAPSGIYESAVDGEAVVYFYVNGTDAVLHAEYAHVTAPTVIRCDVLIDGVPVDTVWAGAGGSHSWWTGAGGRLLPHGLQPGERLEVRLNGPGAFRVDWYDQG